MIPSFIESMIVITRMAKIPISGLKGNLKIKVLLVIYFLSFLVWKKDDCTKLTEDLVKRVAEKYKWKEKEGKGKEKGKVAASSTQQEVKGMKTEKKGK